MLENGYIKLHRKLTSWEWYKNANTMRLFIHLLVTANYEPQKFEGMTINRGQRVASIDTLSSELNISQKSIRIALNHLKRTNEVASLSTPKFTVFTVLNYNSYQDEGQTKGQTKGKPTANEGQTKGNNERKIKKDNKEKEETAPLVAKNKDRWSGGFTDF